LASLSISGLAGETAGSLDRAARAALRRNKAVADESNKVSIETRFMEAPWRQGKIASRSETTGQVHG